MPPRGSSKKNKNKNVPTPSQSSSIPISPNQFESIEIQEKEHESTETPIIVEEQINIVKPIESNSSQSYTPNRVPNSNQFNQFQFAGTPLQPNSNQFYSSSNLNDGNTIPDTIVQRTSSTSTSTLKPTSITISKDTKLLSIDSFQSYKSLILANAKVGGYISYLEMNSQIHWEQLVSRYGSSIEINALYAWYRENHSKVAGMLQLSVNKLIPNFDSINTQLRIENPNWNWSGGYDVQAGGNFSYDNAWLIWRKILSIYERKSIFNLIKLISQLQSLRYTESMDPLVYLSNFQSVWLKINEQLKNENISPGNVLPDSLASVFLIEQLPKSLHYIVPILDTCNQINPTSIMNQISTHYIQTHPMGAQLVRSSSLSNSTRSTTDEAAHYGTDHDTEAVAEQGQYENANLADDAPTRGGDYKKFKSKQKYKNGSSKSNSNSNSNKSNDQEKHEDDFNYSAVDNEEEFLKYIDETDQSEESNSSCSESENESADSDSNEAALHITSQRISTDDQRAWSFKLDSGSTRHIVCNSKLLSNAVKPQYAYTVRGLYGNAGKVTAVGSVKLSSRCTINNVWLIPTATTNLISVGKITSHGVNFEFTPRDAKLIDRGREVMKFEKEGDLYIYTHPDLYKQKVKQPDYEFNRETKPGRIPKKTDTKSTSVSPSSTTVQSQATKSSSTEARAELAKKRDERKQSTSKSNSKNDSTNFAHFATCSDANENNFESKQNDGIVMNSRSGGAQEQIGAAQLLHFKLGHRTLTKEAAEHLNLSRASIVEIQSCDTCLLTKTKRKRVGRGKYEQATQPFERLNVDEMGPISIKNIETKLKIKIPSLGENLYILVIVFTRYVWVRLLKLKSDAANYIIELIQYIRTQYGTMVKRVHSDCGGEFLSNQLLDFYKENGIERTTTTAFSPFHNGICERTNQTLAVMVKSMLLHGRLDPKLWGEAIIYATYIHNRVPLRKLNWLSPYEKLNGKISSISKIHVFGSNCIVNNSATSPSGKFEVCNSKGTFLGVSESANAFRVLVNEKIIVSRDVRIIANKFTYACENEFIADELCSASMLQFETSNTTDSNNNDDDDLIKLPNSIQTEQIQINSNPIIKATISDLDDEKGFDDHTLFRIPEENESENSDLHSHVELDNETIQSNDNIIQVDESSRTRSGRASIPPNRYGTISTNDLDPMSRQQFIRGTGGEFNSLAIEQNEVTFSANSNSSERIVEPQTYLQAMKSKYSSEWSSAIGKEKDALFERNVFSLTEAPENATILDTKWVFKVKYKDDGTIEKFKARLVVRGYKQREGIDFSSTFAPVVRSKTIKLLLSLAAQHGLKLVQLDFTNAFVNSDLPDNLYIKIPEGLQTNETHGKVYKLEKSLYGLRQAPALWNQTVNNLFIELGYIRSITDTCVYFKYVKSDSMPIIISVYVDDIAIAFDKQFEEVWIIDKKKITSKYAITDIGDLKWILQMNVTRMENGDIILDQRNYVEQLVNKFYSADPNATTSNNPSMVSINLTDPQLTAKYQAVPLSNFEHEKYRSIVGSLLYFANTTRADISFIVNILCRAVSEPTTVHMKVAMNCIKYLKGTATHGLVFHSRKPIRSNSNKLSFTLIGFADSDFAGDLTTRKSTSGTLIKLNDDVITWSTKKQSTVALSTMEAEYCALVHCATDCLWIQQWLHEILNIQVPIILYCDNQSTLYVIRDDDHHASQKHVDIKLHFIRHHVQSNNIIVKWIATDKQLADLMTKTLSAIRFRNLRDQIISNIAVHGTRI